MRAPMLGFLVVLTAAACEDGPEQLFQANEGDPELQNGYKPNGRFTQEGDRGFDEADAVEGRDKEGRAQFCDDAVQTELVQWMVVQPIIPDVGVAGVKMWNEDGTPLHADDLLGEGKIVDNNLEGKFCDPNGVYANAFTWGPTDEVIVFFDQDTRLIDYVVAYQQYLGKMEAAYTDDQNVSHTMVIQPREKIKIDDSELDQYSSREDQETKTNSWLNNQNVTKIYRAIRETFFNASPFPEDYDCVEAQLCDLIYTDTNESNPQDTWIVLRDSGIQLRMSPEGDSYFVTIFPVRVAPFETGGEIQFAPNPTDTEMAFRYQSTTRPSCIVDLDAQTNWAEFSTMCVDPGDTRTLQRALYDVHTQRDAIDVDFNGLSLNFMRKTSEDGVCHRNEQPLDADVLYGMSYYVTLAAPTAEFKPLSLATAYKTKLEARLANSVRPTFGSTTTANHPIVTFEVQIPASFTDDPQRIGELFFEVAGERISWVDHVMNQIWDIYDSLDPIQQDQVDLLVLDPIYLVEPFVDATLEAFSHGESELPGTFKVYRTSDDHRWSIGTAHFLRAGIPYRVEAQYSLDWGRVNAVNVSRGESEVGTVFNSIKDLIEQLNPGLTGPYYSFDLALVENNPYGLDGTGVVVTDFDRELGTVDVELSARNGNQWITVELEVPGTHMTDRGGYMRQTRGERYEFVPAHKVYLYGKENQFLVYVREDGTIGRVVQPSYKGSIELCPGLSIAYGDNIRDKINEWVEIAGTDAHRNCEIVFNYSVNGNILDEVASLSNRVGITVFDERAVTAAAWR